MDTPEQAELRRAVRLAIDRDGSRATARQIGMSPTGLRKFARGTSAFPATWDKVRAWYAREVEQGATAREAAPVAVDALVRLVDPDLQESARRAVTAILGTLYGVRGRPVPAWLAMLDGALDTYEEATRSHADRIATVYPLHGAPFPVVTPPTDGEPRDVARYIAERGAWNGDVFVPPHRIKQVRLGADVL